MPEPCPMTNLKGVSGHSLIGPVLNHRPYVGDGDEEEVTPRH